MTSRCTIPVSFVTIPASSVPLNPPPPIFTMPPEVLPLPDDKSEVASPSSVASSTNASSHLSSDRTSPHPSRQTLETYKTANVSQLESPPSPKAPANSSTKPQASSPPPSSTSPPQNLPPPPPSSGSPKNPPPPPNNRPPPPENPAPPQNPPPPIGPPAYPPPPLLPPPPPSSGTIVSPSPPLISPPSTSGSPAFPAPSLFTPPPSSGTLVSPTPPLLSPPSISEILVSPIPPLLTPPSTSGTPVSPSSPFSTPTGTSLVPPHAPTNHLSNNAPENEGGAITTRVAVEIGLIVSILLLTALGITFFCMFLRKKRNSRHFSYLMPASVISSPMSGNEYLKMRHSPANAAYDYSASETGGLGNSKSLYTYKELVKATDEFSEKNLLGGGGFGLVYKGCLTDGREVAVKQLKEGGGQGEREFRAEVKTISHVHHKHLVSLVGYCISKSQRLLVYDYVPNKTLHFHLHEQDDPVLDWDARLKIALGAARGIAYLHEDCHPRIIHRDIKSSNILVDNNFEAQVSDFGLARLFSDSYTHVTTRVMGTFGYMAPEYALSGKLTDKSDVFSFGVVLLELITGRKPVDSSQPLGEESLVEWARPLLNSALEGEDFEALVDPRLKDNYVDSEMFCMIEAAASCVRHLAAKRPKMMQVLRAFDSITMVSDLTNGMRVGESKLFDTTLKPAEFKLLQNMAFGCKSYSSDFFTQGSWKREDCEM
ncbi:hypothetical protein LIER_07447 [Lithospermum erythrorhizon]|uniref:non-specific serine/threonine protein kinase n=1 Tax=Lithospermum erythrorhizon TaxID=34254 RepID=A0AAV3P9E9_LITER